MPNVLSAQWVRFLWLKEMLNDASTTAEAIEIFTAALDRCVKNNYFRWFDSGDLFSLKAIDFAYEVCVQTPDINFWFPTRGYWSKNVDWNNRLTKLAGLPNVTVRPSALYYDDNPPIIDFLSAGTTVVLDENLLPEDTKLCPKTLNGGSCESNDCRSCWDKDEQIAYLVHGVMGKSKPYPISDKIKMGRAAMKQKFVTLTIGNQL